MKKSKAIEVLNKIYHDSVVYKAMIKRTTNKVVDDVDDTMIALLTAIDALEHDSSVEAEHDNGWISVKNRLPDEDTWVLVYARQGSYTNLKVDYIHGGVWFNSMLVTHWMPLPQKPESEDNAK